MKRFVALLCTLLLYGSLSQAAVTINFVESGGDVVATSSGSINTAGFDIKTSLGGSSLGFIQGTNVSASWLCIIGTGAFSGSTDAYVLSSFTSDNTEVCATQNSGASSGSGDFVGVISRLGSSSGTDGVYVPLGYVSGNPISGTSTWSAATFASLGLLTGTQVFTWGSGADTDSLTLNIGGSVAPTTYSVGGNVSGLTGTGLQLQNNGADTLVVAAEGPFTFVTELADSSTYTVTVSTQPTGQTCSVTNGSGTIAAADVADIGVTCEDDIVPPIDPLAPVVPVPTLSQWALIMLSMLFGLMVFSNRKRLL